MIERKKTTIILVATLCSLAVMLSGCKKNWSSRLEGKWKMEQMVTNPTSTIYWTFEGDSKLTIINDYNCCINDTASGEYKFSVKNLFFSKQVKITSPLGLDGNWKIEKLTKKILVLTRISFTDNSTGGAYLRREFTKQ